MTNTRAFPKPLSAVVVLAIMIGFTLACDGITDDVFAAYAMIEEIPGIGDMGYAGTATGTIDEKGKVVATFSGEYRLGYERRPVPVLCQAPDHLIEVTPTDALTARLPVQEVKHGGVV